MIDVDLVWTDGDVTLSGLRLKNLELSLPRVAKAQPWPGISERFQRCLREETT
jgi:hypothetical protein